MPTVPKFPDLFLKFEKNHACPVKSVNFFRVPDVEKMKKFVFFFSNFFPSVTIFDNDKRQ